MSAKTTPICEFGWNAPDFRLRAVDGRTYTRSDIAGRRGMLVMFLCNHCPYVQAVIGRIVRDVEALADHGIGSIAIMPNDTRAYPADSFERMSEFAAEQEFDFPYAIDESQDVARTYGAVCTPDFFGFNASLGLQYRGRLDASRLEPLDGVRRELFEAMVDVANTGHGPVEQSSSMGCSIKWRNEN